MKIIFLLSGLITLVVGVIGLFMPIHPTTPFMLLSAYCFARSSERMYIWLMTNRYFGRYLSDYRSGYGVPPKIKIFALSFLWLTTLWEKSIKTIIKHFSHTFQGETLIANYNSFSNSISILTRD